MISHGQRQVSEDMKTELDDQLPDTARANQMLNERVCKERASLPIKVCLERFNNRPMAA
jgi:hypothetical protein